MEKIELRSDTMTLPTQEMLESILTAKLGDDVVQEDETVLKLEALAAKTFNKEAALLVTSGSQGNLVSLLSHTHPGDEIFLEDHSHIYYYEIGSFSSIAGLTPQLLPSNRGIIDPEVFESRIRPNDIHFPNPRLLAIENTHNTHGGVVIPKENIDALADIAHDHGLSVHMDGARVFNAQVASGVPVAQITENVDSVMFCLSKGLSAPVGSLVVGTAEFIERARKNRKLLGGGMRQAGIIAAPGIIALTKMVERLKEDHENAKYIEQRLRNVPGLKVNPVETNIVIFDVSGTGKKASEIVSYLESKGVLSFDLSPTIIRFVTHRNVNKEQIKTALDILEEYLS